MRLENKMNSCVVCKTLSSLDYIKSNFEGLRVPLDGTVELTHKCNFRCVHCYGAHERAEEDLSYEQWIDIFQQIKEAGCLNLIFTGGEALIRNDFKKLYLKAREMGFMVIVFSNASLLTEEIAKMFWEYPITYFSTTMYGFTPSTYAEITGKEENYFDFMKGLQLLKKYCIPVELKAIALKENFTELKSIYEYAKKEGYMFRCSSGIRARNDSQLTPIDYALSPEDALKLDVEFFPERIEFWKQQAKSPCKQPYTENRRKNKFKYLCHIGEQSFMIDASGNIHCCGIERSVNMSVLENGFEMCWRELMPNVINKKTEETFKCLSCKDFRYCEQCTARIELESSEGLVPSKEMCKLAKLRHQWCDLNK